MKPPCHSVLYIIQEAILLILTIFAFAACISGVEEKDYLTYVTIDEGYYIADYAEYAGTEYQYVVYELESYDEYFAYSDIRKKY